MASSRSSISAPGSYSGPAFSAAKPSGSRLSSFAVAVPSLAPAAEAEAGRLPPPAAAEAAAAQTPLNSAQQAMAIGEPIGVVFCRRRNDAGGVLVFPKATEAAFSNTSTQQTARYHCVLGIGPMGSIQTRDFRIGACRVGSFSQNYDKRAGTWSPGNTATPQPLYQVPTFPTACGGGGNYAGLATLEFSNTTTGGSDDWRTGCNVFVRNGLTVTRLLDSASGSSDNIADLVLWAWQRSSRVPASMIDTASLTAAARFCDVNGLLCNGEFTESANLGDWLIGLLPHFLLRETRIGGKFGLRPLLPTNADGTLYLDTIAPDWVFGESVIAPDSFSQEWSDAGTRLAPKLTMLWRQQSEVDMPIVRSLEVGLGRSGPAEQHDLSRFCASEIHAARVGAYLHGRRYLSTHTAAVTLIPGSHSGQISQGDIVVIRLPLVTGREADGLISDWYAVESVAPAADGSEALTLSHFPVDSQARSLLALQVANVVAPGALLPFPAIGACDVAGRSTSTIVPASTTSGTTFSSGGGGIILNGGGGGGGGSGGGNGYNEAPVPDNGPPSEEAPKDPPLNPTGPGGLPNDPPRDVPVGGSVPDGWTRRVNRGIDEEPPGTGGYRWSPMPYEPDFWNTAAVVFRITGGGFSYINTPGPGGAITGGTVGDADTLFTVNFTWPAGPVFSLPGGDVTQGVVSGQPAQIIGAAALVTNQSTYYGGDFAWIPATSTFTAGPTKQTIKIVSWTRTS